MQIKTVRQIRTVLLMLLCVFGKWTKKPRIVVVIVVSTIAKKKKWELIDFLAFDLVYYKNVHFVAGFHDFDGIEFRITL